MKIIASLFFGIFLASTSSALAQNWQGIKPIESTCKDVERVLGGKACGEWQIKYELPTANIYINFSNATCKDKWPGKYDVPAGTVTSVQAFLRRANLSLSDLNIDKSKLKEGDAGDMIGIDVFESDELGIKLEVSEEGKVITATYFPAAKYDRLLCSKAAKDPPRK